MRRIGKLRLRLVLAGTAGLAVVAFVAATSASPPHEPDLSNVASALPACLLRSGALGTLPPPLIDCSLYVKPGALIAPHREPLQRARRMGTGECSKGPKA